MRLVGAPASIATAGGFFLALCLSGCAGQEPGGQAGSASGAGDAGGTGGSSPSGGASGSPSGASGGVTAGGGASGEVGSGGSGAEAGAGGSSTQGGSENVGGTESMAGADSGGSAGSGGAGESPHFPVPPSAVIVSGPSGYWKEVASTSGSTATITVTSREAQLWHGFGGTFTEMGWDALLALSEEDRLRALLLLFDLDQGLGLTWGKVPVGASDYAMSRYTHCETEDDFAMDTFSISRDEEALIPFIVAAQKLREDLRFFGVPWTPPTWMKSPQGYDAGVMNDDPAYLAAYATYLVEWVNAYEQAGIPIDHLQPQNEPDLADAHPSCSWGPNSNASHSVSPAFLGTFTTDYLVPALQAGAPGTGVWYGTFSNSLDIESYFDDLEDEGAIVGLGLQWGTLENVVELRERYPQLLLMQTEHRMGNYPFQNPSFPDYYTSDPEQTSEDLAPNDYDYARESWDWIVSWITRGVHSYQVAHFVLDTRGLGINDERVWHQNALLVVDRDTGRLYETPFYWVLRHVAQYVRPGAVRLETEGNEALAFRNTNGSLIVIAHNPEGQEIQASVTDGATTHEFSIPGYGFATVSFETGG